MDRSNLATAMENAGIPSLLLSLRSHSPSPWITVLTYHRAAPVSAAADFIESLSASCGVSMSTDEERAIANSLLMTWDHVKKLRREGMDVQSHTSTHRVLQTLHEEQLAEELGGSREVLEGIMGEKIRA